MLSGKRTRGFSLTRGFTLIELLVVIAIIALLVSILLPALQGARREGWATKTASGARQVALAVNTYGAQFREQLPPSYVYGASNNPEDFNWRVQDQQSNNPNPSFGYIHWSSMLFDGNNTNREAFQSPATPFGGAPATNPGSTQDAWDPSQVSNTGGTSASPSTTVDRQVPRCVFTGNAGLFPRNKFDPSQPNRKNRLVRYGEVSDPSKTILVTEFITTNGSWRALYRGNESRAHRPITPLFNRASGASAGDQFYVNASNNLPQYAYPQLRNATGQTTNVLQPTRNVPDETIDGGSGLNGINLIGRHHPPVRAEFGGTAHFAFLDGHVERMSAEESVERKLWGSKVWSVTGPNGVANNPEIP